MPLIYRSHYFELFFENEIKILTKKIVIWGRLIMKNVFPFHFSFNDKDTYNNYLTLQKKNLSAMMTHENRNRILSA